MSVYIVQPKYITHRNIIGDDIEELNDKPDSKSLVLKCGSTTQDFVRDRTRDYGEHELLDYWDTTRPGALYIEQHLITGLESMGWKKWRNKKEWFQIKKNMKNKFLMDACRIVEDCLEDLQAAELTRKNREMKRMVRCA